MTSNSHQSPTSFKLVIKGKFFFIYEDLQNWILEDKTKRGLEVREKIPKEEKNILVDIGMIYDMDGNGHKVTIRSYYPKSEFSFEQVHKEATIMEKRYLEIREMTCPDDL